MSELAIINFKLPKNFYRSYSEINQLSNSELPSIDRVIVIINKIEQVKTCDLDTASDLLVNLDSCYPNKTDKRLEGDFFTNAVLALFQKYTPNVCMAAMTDIVENEKFLPVIAIFKEYLDKHNQERLRPLSVANMYRRRIEKLKPKGESATPEQIQKVRDKLK